jgi:hypothetical protein
VKKRMTQKLKLNRETLRSLDDERLRDAAGAVTQGGTLCSQNPCQSISYCYACISVPQATCTSVGTN